jgi:biopolymer transport protein ExbD
MTGGWIPKRRRRTVLELQLTAMIDIFSMIVIFLIFGTVFGATELPIPRGLRVPTSFSDENVSRAPRLVIGSREVRTSISQEPLSIDLFRPNRSEDLRIAKLKEKLKDYVAGLPQETRDSGVLLNVIADREAPYRDIYDVITVFRQAGFEALVFVASGEGSK